MALVVKSPPANAGDIREDGLIPGGGHGNSLQYFCLENTMDRGAWQAMVHSVAKSWIQLKKLRICMILNKFTSILYAYIYGGIAAQ